MESISFCSANYVARVVNFEMTGGWGQGDRTTNEYFSPIETFGERFGEMVASVRALGFDAIDMWQAHLNWTWATDEHIALAREALARNNLTVTSTAGGFGETLEQFEAACRLTVALGCRILGGSTLVVETDRAGTVALLEKYDLVLGLENHPHIPTPEAMLERIGDGANGQIGSTVDTGWYGTTGIDVVQALKQLDGHIMLIHLKDVLAEGSHETCRYGSGCVPIEGCVRQLQRQGYTGGYSIEHEPETFDPTDDVVADLAMLRGWLSEGGR
jgi:L-ribulose-5-phosphate 3-epimerase